MVSINDLVELYCQRCHKMMGWIGIRADVPVHHYCDRCVRQAKGYKG